MYSKDFIKGTLKPILLALLSEQGEMYGYEMTQAVKLRTKDEISLTEGALYPALHKMESAGLVQTHLKTFNGRNRKYYALTAKGRQEAEKAKKSWFRFSGLMEQLMSPYHV